MCTYYICMPNYPTGRVLCQLAFENVLTELTEGWCFEILGTNHQEGEVSQSGQKKMVLEGI